RTALHQPSGENPPGSSPYDRAYPSPGTVADLPTYHEPAAEEPVPARPGRAEVPTAPGTAPDRAPSSTALPSRVVPPPAVPPPPPPLPSPSLPAPPASGVSAVRAGARARPPG